MASSNEFIIKVKGVSAITRPAERAQLNLKVSSSEPSKEEASRNVLATAQRIHARLTGMRAKNDAGEPAEDAPLTHFSMSSINNSTMMPRDRENRLIDPIFTVTTNFEAKFKDFAKLGQLAAEYSSVRFVDVTSVTWLLTQATQASLASQNRREAMRDAIVRAKDYADAADRSQVVPVEVEESVTNISASGKQAQHAARLQMKSEREAAGPGSRSAESTSADSGQDMGASLLIPEDVQVHHTISAKFRVL